MTETSSHVRAAVSTSIASPTMPARRYSPWDADRPRNDSTTLGERAPSTA
jgi:hypothetical protein